MTAPYRYMTGASALSILLSAGPVSAQDLDLGVIVVTPNRAPTELAKTGSSVTVIGAEEIEGQSLPLVTDYLNQVPGVAITSPGGSGTESSLAIRGAPRRYVKTLYNGIDISDPTNTQVQTSYQYLLSGGLDSIEVLRGSQSTLYGSDAIAGVISMSTLGDIDPGITHLLSAEGGSFGTARASYGLRAADERSKLSFNATGFRTDGISAAASGTERDGYENITLDIAGEHEFSDAFSVFGSALWIDAEAEFDDDGNPPIDNLFNTNFSTQKAGRVGFNLDLMDGRLKNTFAIQAFDIERRVFSTTFGPYNGIFDGQRVKAEYQGEFEVTDRVALLFGADHERQNAKYSDDVGSLPTDNSFSQTGLWAMAAVEPLDNLHLTLGARHDEHSVYGGHATWRATGAYFVPDSGTRLHASVGSGFRAPSLFELYDPFSGYPNLKPETSTGFDLGIEQRFLDNRLLADVTYFQLAIDNLIQCTPPGGFCRYEQIGGTSRHQGVEVSLAYDVNSWLSLAGSYTYTHAEDQTGERLPRIPRHAIGLAVEYRPAEKWTVSTSGKIATDTVDDDGFELDDYFLLNAKIAYKPTEDTELYVRAENLLDQDYQTARGYGTPDFSVFAGFKTKIGP